MEIEEWKSQLKRGILEYCVLLLIRGRPRYGYEIISRIGGWDIIAAKESTVYPLLRRLQKEGYLTAYWGEAQDGGLPPRKYYTITASGEKILELMDGQWANLVTAIGVLQTGEESMREAAN